MPTNLLTGVRNTLALLAFLLVVACDQPPKQDPEQSKGPGFMGIAKVALLVPYGSEDPNDMTLAVNLQNSARMALDDLTGVQIELRTYPTLGTKEGAAAAAEKAIADGADIFLGPVYSDTASAAASVAEPSGVNVLAFSNNARIAGKNLFVLGNTFENRARRILAYGTEQGRSRVLIVHADNPSGSSGRDAIAKAAEAMGITVTGIVPYEFTQKGVVDAVPVIASLINETQTDLVFFTANSAGALPLLAQLLPENDIDLETVKFAGLGRWDIPRSTLRLSGLEGGWFPLPDPRRAGAFNSRYRFSNNRPPHTLAGLSYDGIAFVSTLIRNGQADPFGTERILSAGDVFGAHGVFRMTPDGTVERALTVAEIEDGEVAIASPSPRSFDGLGL